MNKSTQLHEFYSVFSYFYHKLTNTIHNLLVKDNNIIFYLKFRKKHI